MNLIAIAAGFLLLFQEIEAKGKKIVK